MMNKSNTLITLIVMALLGLCSCANYKNVPYFQNADQFDGSAGTSLYDMTIKPKDRLMIVVFSSTDGEAVAPFNMREPSEPRYQNGRMVASASQARRLHRYQVANDGNINYPVLGTVHVAGLTIDSINSHIRRLITPYLQPGADCLVKTLIENYEITVIGEVQNPNTFTLDRPEVNVLEALALAGDMTIYGKRDNVKILRELPDGTYEVHELDMRDANILNSPYYYLQQRDIVYVEPNEAMVQNAKIGQTTQLWVSGASITISLGSLLYRILQ